MTRWTAERLEALRRVADPEVDPLVEAVLPAEGGAGRLGYNRMLELADRLLEHPELALAADSAVARELAALPAEVRDYFDPVPAPAWVDPARLELASRLWRSNTLPCLAVLYASSLPSCYTIARGIPALYRTEKLHERRYIFQRIYETGLFLEAVLEPGGIALIEEPAADGADRTLVALRSLDASGGWQRESGALVRSAGAPPTPLDAARVRAEVERTGAEPRRWLWGRGVLAARKVRFLHASMRFYLERPERIAPRGGQRDPATLAEQLSRRVEPWDREALGAPVNQEDLAFTLLTFGYLIPRGLADLGIRVDPAERDGFLHLWRVVGHLLGIRDGLLTDGWDGAAELFAVIAGRQAAASREGMELAAALRGFLGDYLPHLPGVGDRLSAAVMIRLMGLDAARLVLPDELVAATRRPWRRAIHGTARLGLAAYFRLRGALYGGLRLLGERTAGRLHDAAVAFVASWRDAYSRRPFLVPADATRWEPAPGAGEALADELRRWRRRLFRTLVAALGLLIGGSLVGIGGLVTWLAGWTGPWAAAALPAGWLAAMAILRWRVPAVVSGRPRTEAGRG